MKNRKNITMRSLVLLLTLATSAAIVGTAHGDIGSRLKPDPMDREPLVIFDISGHGIGGPIHQHLVVYSGGLASISALHMTESYSDMEWVTAERARELNDAVIAAGALELRDRWTDDVADFPMTTITVFNGNGPSAVHNTFSFYDLGQAREYEAVIGVVEAFIREVFFPEQQ